MKYEVYFSRRPSRKEKIHLKTPAAYLTVQAAFVSQKSSDSERWRAAAGDQRDFLLMRFRVAGLVCFLAVSGRHPAFVSVIF